MNSELGSPISGHSPSLKKAYFCLALVLLASGGSVLAFVNPPSRALETQNLRGLIREFQTHLGSYARVSVFIVKKNDRLASVRPSKKNSNAYFLEVDEGFLSTLAQEERRAMVAHELGHVWIFTHPPFLHSEPLANQKAALLVSQESLRKIYSRVWQLDGQSTPLPEFLRAKFGPAEPSVASTIPPPSGEPPATGLVFLGPDHN